MRLGPPVRANRPGPNSPAGRGDRKRIPAGLVALVPAALLLVACTEEGSTPTPSPMPPAPSEPAPAPPAEPAPAPPAEPAPAPPAEPAPEPSEEPEITGPPPNIMLHVTRVNDDWAPFLTNFDGWSKNIHTRESPHLKYFEAVIWLDYGAVHLYEFPNDLYGERSDGILHGTLNFDLSPEEWTARRESFRVLEFPGFPAPPEGELSTPATTRFLRESFQDIASHLVARYPDANHHLGFHGHGAPGGRLFEYLMVYEDADRFLDHWTSLLGRRLGVIDMGSQCNKGGYEDLTNFCQYAEYYVGSDLVQGGFEFTDWTSEKFLETHYEEQYHRFFEESPTLSDVLVRRVDLLNTRWEYGREDLVEKRHQQALYLYSCENFEPFAAEFIPFLARTREPWEGAEDLLAFLQSAGADGSLIALFHDTIAHSADNRDFFDWRRVQNGMTMPHPDWWGRRR